MAIAALREKLLSFRREIIGDATLWLGDCREIFDLLPAVDAVVTDPPYGIAYESGHATEALWAAGGTIVGDSTVAARDFVAQWSAPRPALFLGSGRAPRPPNTRTVLVWDKGGALGMGALDIPWKPDHEEIYVLGKGFIGTRDSGSVLRCPPVQSMAKNGRLHPTEKPVALMETLVAKVPGTVLDPFMGSGSTAVACAKLGRRFIGIECEPKYFDIACKRIDEAHRQPRLFQDEAPKLKQEALL